MEYISLFFTSFLSATLLPMGSEALLLFYSHDSDLIISMLWLVASVGNTLGACVNWWLGSYLDHFQNKRWFPCTPAQLARAQYHFAKYGQLSLLFSWLPIIGDPLCLIAGTLKTPFLRFFMLVFIGKTTRYFFLLYLVL
ncbi:DedA family protein [Marinomonas agarivorans]|nr:DedA family protein [Marinomonas agarivorans]